MTIPPRTTLAERIAGFLREEIRRGRRKGRLPGAVKLAAELEVSKDTLLDALALLEREGLVVRKGAGKPREIVPVSARVSVASRRRLRVGILPYEDPHDSPSFKQRQLLMLVHEIEAAGHAALLAPRSQLALKCEPARIVPMVEATGADLWIVMNGAGPVTERLRARGIPVFALGGRWSAGVPAAAYDPGDAMRAALARLLDSGHRRIVLVCPRAWRLPETGPYVRDFFDLLRAAGVPAGDFNAPDWTETPEGFAALLRSLFALTPPTALIVGDARQATAVTSFLAARGLTPGRDVSLVVRVPDPVFDWSATSVARFDFDETLVVRRAVRWIAGFAKGAPDAEATLFPMRFVDGDTVGAPRA